MNYARICLTAALVASASPLYAQDTDAQLRLDLSRLQVYTETRQLDSAFTLIERLKAENPTNAQVRVAEADLQIKLGNRGAALTALKEAESLDPGNQDIINRREEIRMPRSYVSADGSVKRTNNLSLEQYSRLSGSARVTPDIAVGATLENDHARIDPIVRENGTTARFEGDRQRFTLTGQRVEQSGNQLDANLYLTKETVGAGARYSWLDAKGLSYLQADVFAPEWDYLEGVVGYGTRDDIRVGRKQYFTPALEGNLNLGVNHYGLDGDRDLATTGMVNGELDYIIPSRFHHIGLSAIDNTTFTLNYMFDAEYAIDVDDKNGPSGRYRPFPFSSYEVHGFTLSLSRELMTDLTLDAFGGWAFDRLGGDGPQYGGALTYAPYRGPQVQLRASRGISGERGTDRYDQVGLNVAWRF